MLDATIDIYHGNTLTDPAALKAAGVGFVWLKATQANRAAGPIDPAYKERKATLKSMGFVVGAYAFGCPGDGASQADLLIDTAGVDGETPLALDLENEGNALMSLAEAEAFVSRIYHRTGKWPVLYTRQSIMVQLAGTKPTLLSNCELWIAHYGVPTPTIPSQWTKWFLWQRDSKQTPGFASIVDHDLFDGTVDELKAKWRSLAGTLQQELPAPTYNGFDWPIGTAAERAIAIDRLPGLWIDANPIGTRYEITPGVFNYHDGSDLNLNSPQWNADYLQPLYAIGNGVVMYAGVGGGSWGHIIDIKHPLRGGGYVVSRFGHVANTIVVTGDIVYKGQQVAQVGNADGAYPVANSHLHFNISKPNNPIMINTPNQWCGTNLQCVWDNYTDPIAFIAADKKGATPMLVSVKWVGTNRVPIYDAPSLLAKVIDYLQAGGSSQLDNTPTTGDQSQIFYKVGNGYVAGDCVDFVSSPPVTRYTNTPGSVLIERSAGVKPTPPAPDNFFGTLAHGTTLTVVLPPNANGYVKVATINGAAVTRETWVYNGFLAESRPQFRLQFLFRQL